MSCTNRPLLTAALLVPLLCHSAAAWWDCGHHVIAVLAYNELSAIEQRRLIAVLKEHPRFEEDFAAPEGTVDPERWYIGQAGTWPDVARNLGDEWNRPSWHYELGSTLVIGDDDDTDVPDRPGPLPADATLETKWLYASQAIEMCWKVMASPAQPPADRAIALSWLAHLVADVHQPCHAGSLYVAGVFPDGDRGANRIDVQQDLSLHALWDSLLGSHYDRGDINRRVASISGNRRLLREAKESTKRLTPQAWLKESREAAVKFVYTDEVLNPIRAVRRGLTPQLMRIDLSEGYLRDAGRLAELRAAQAAYRLAAGWRQALRNTAADASEPAARR